MSNNDEDIPYFTDPLARIAQAAPQNQSNDEADYDTLRAVQTTLSQSIADLYRDFNAFKIDKNKVPLERDAIIARQIEVNQGVYDIVAPLLDHVNSAIESVDNKYKAR